MQSKVTLTFRMIEWKSFYKTISKQNRKTFWKYKKKGGAAPPSTPLNPPMRSDQRSQSFRIGHCHVNKLI